MGLLQLRVLRHHRREYNRLRKLGALLLSGPYAHDPVCSDWDPNERDYAGHPGGILQHRVRNKTLQLVRVHLRYKTKPSETRAGMVADIILYLIPGFVIFIFLPTGVFMHFEGWTFVESLYYAFVTLTTIGFGDFVAGQTDKHRDSEGLYLMYKVMLLVWIVFGLGYLVMILGFITRAMRSKKVAQLERKLATNLRQTHSKLWNTFTRDVSYLRHVINEMYVLTLKPIYKDEEEIGFTIRTRSSSEPMLYDLSSHDDEIIPGFGVWRLRANSEAAAAGSRPVRVMSESDLERIDKDATFKSAAAKIQPGELLAHMVNALGEEENGLHGFSDTDILASEEPNATWNIGGEAIPKQRKRAASEVRIPMKEQQDTAEWTWSGDEASRRVHGLFRAGLKSLVPSEHTTRRPSIFQLAAAKIKQPLKKRHKSKSIGDLFIAPENPSVPCPPMHPALEETSLADFLRAVSSFQTRVATPPDSAPPRRKAGTASMTPPGSLMSLFTPHNIDRRMSLRPIPTSRLNYAASRRASLASVSTPPPMNRRMSLRPAPLSRLPPTSSRRGSLHPANRRFSVRPATSTLPPPSSPPPALHLMAPHLFKRQTSESGHVSRK
ncbi:open rectifier potassium channel protein 1 isoform X2 [Cryptotermes secundus]|uniref:open rectifier potassium channel protein 1 isoform X2 n=1 Tax=Cryptotermes secundus TaxID=105785 RepID=UPI000CD7AC1A|nr:open rectifier potassium channel protein 1 isoform X2 [Cryptotermes secundus]